MMKTCLKGVEIMEDRVSVSVSEVGSVTVKFFYYQGWNFFVPADYVEDAESVMEHIKDEYIAGARTPNRIQKGFERHRSEIEEAVSSEMNGGAEK